MTRKVSHSKMNNLVYHKLEMQEYLTQADLTKEQKRMLAQWRVNMCRFEENFRFGREMVLCPLCHKHRDFWRWSFHCEFITSRIVIHGRYDDIYNQNHEDLPRLIKTLNAITRIRDTYK